MWAIAAARLVLPARDPRAGAAQPLRRPGAAARRRHRRLGRRLAGHGRPREPRAGLAGARRPARGHRGGRPHAGAPADRLPDVRPRPGALARPGAALPGARRLRRRGPGPRRRRGARGARSRRRRCSTARRPCVCRRPVARPPAGRWPRCWPAWPSGQEVGEAEIVTLFGARGPEVRLVAEVADDLRRRIVGDDVTFVRNRNINYTNVCTFKCRFCAFSKGPLSLNLRGAPYLLELDEITRRVAEAEAEGATEVCLQGGIHPNFDGDYYLHVLEAVRAALDRHPHPRLHRARGDRGGAPLRGAAGRVPDPPEGGRAQDAAGHGGRDPRRRGPRRALPRQDQHRGVARGAPHRAQRRPALQHHHHVRLGRAAGQLGPPHRAHPGAPARDGRLHRVRAAALRAHGHPDLPPAQGAAGTDLPRGRC